QQIKGLSYFLIGIAIGIGMGAFFYLLYMTAIGLACWFFTLTGLCLLAKKACLSVVRIRQLQKELASFNASSKQTPNFEDSNPEVLSWHALLKSCESRHGDERFTDGDLGIEGSPGKLIKKVTICMPVFQCRLPSPKHPDLADDLKARLYPQHFIRMKAYCHLIEQNMGFDSRCGIVVFSGTLKAIAIKFLDDDFYQERMEDAVERAHEAISSKNAKSPSSNICRNCHLGRLRTYRAGTQVISRDGRQINPRLNSVVHHGKRKEMHSVCGDFFEWVAPHQNAIDQKLAKDI
ncbi:MAG: hypothetical protein AAF623_21170, partial [Planctomycetota bacterium]